MIRRMHTPLMAVGAAAALAVLSACSSGAETAADTNVAAGNGASTSSTADSCAVGNLPLKQKGVLNVHTDQPVYSPWFIDNDPSNGKGYESALTYAVAKQMGFKPEDVKWGYTAFTASFAPGPKAFDMYTTEVSITDARKKAVAFSQPYYKTPLVVMAKKGSPAAKATTMEGLKNFKFGAQVGSIYANYITQVIKPTPKMAVFNSNSDSTQALENGQIDAALQTLQIGENIVTNQFKDFTLVGVLPDAGSDIGYVFDLDSKLVSCVNKALDELKADGTVKKLQQEWLKPARELPTFTK